MAKKNLKRGIFITFEGVEGCGKSTHSRLIYKYLKKSGFSCLHTREPGGTSVGNKIRKILLDSKNKAINDIAELFLFEASRSQIVDEVIKPALKKKRVVLCDRFFDATMAYQGYGDKLDKTLIKRLNFLATKGLKPDLTIILDIGSKEGLRRATRYSKKDRMEQKKISFHKRVRKGYIDIARRNHRRVKLIATRDDMAQTQELIRQEVLDVIQGYKTTR